jgi:Tfp pilus assembly major pilin PilA
MYCQKCGTKNDDNAYKCTRCGIVIQGGAAKKKTNAAIIVLIVAAAALVFFAVIGILAAIAIPQFAHQRTRAANVMAQTEVRNACYAAAEFFMDYPYKAVTLAALQERGIGANPDIEVFIENGTMNGLSIRVRHKKGNKGYVADKNCDVREIQP